MDQLSIRISYTTSDFDHVCKDPFPSNIARTVAKMLTGSDAHVLLGEERETRSILFLLFFLIKYLWFYIYNDVDNRIFLVTVALLERDTMTKAL